MIVDSLYDVYQTTKTSKEPWYALLQKYHSKNAGNWKYLVNKFFYLKIVDGKLVLYRGRDFQIIINHLLAEGYNFNEYFLVSMVLLNYEQIGKITVKV